MLIICNFSRYCDEQFVKAQARELAEAANMSNQQFNSAARMLLERERAGEIELPMTNRSTYRYGGRGQYGGLIMKYQWSSSIIGHY